MLKVVHNVILFILLTVIQVHSRTKDPINILTKIATKNDINPLVVRIDTSKKKANVVNLFADDKDGGTTLNHFLPEPIDNILSEDYTDDETLEEIAKDAAKKLISNFLRTSPSADSKLEDRKQALRQALRARCKKVTTCIIKCKVEKPSCPTNCQKVFDDLNLCDTPKETCKKPRCGKTMPPYWLL